MPTEGWLPPEASSWRPTPRSSIPSVKISTPRLSKLMRALAHPPHNCGCVPEFQSIPQVAIALAEPTFQLLEIRWHGCDLLDAWRFRPHTTLLPVVPWEFEFEWLSTNLVPEPAHHASATPSLEKVLRVLELTRLPPIVAGVASRLLQPLAFCSRALLFFGGRKQLKGGLKISPLEQSTKRPQQETSEKPGLTHHFVQQRSSERADCRASKQSAPPPDVSLLDRPAAHEGRQELWPSPS